MTLFLQEILLTNVILFVEFVEPLRGSDITFDVIFLLLMEPLRG
jgi:aminoglycoside phosphotransferase family enzyme